MKTFFFLAGLCCLSSAFAQTNEKQNDFFSKPEAFKNSKPSADFNKKMLLKRIKPVPDQVRRADPENGNMPNGIPVENREMYKPKDQYSIGNGLMAFESPLDKMKVISPDSTFHSNMPMPKMYLSFKSETK
ncbi:hypothetical protein QTN47_23480 [Danxiaibacter flavus]|uniref:Uncharacterized protein n=1 Tax=Danxiaibacter flavus TaxID=3049108 RepID=A0ABV3ZN18_9BACT|nr:hypothetical protein QNM32_23485 [Chitinophagaceae bacterium DXS]